MKKSFYVLPETYKAYNTFEEASVVAKRSAAKGSSPYSTAPENNGVIIAETYAYAKAPVPDIEVVKL